MANGEEMATDGQFVATLCLCGHTLPVVLIVGQVQQEVVLGMDFMSKYKIT